MYHRKYYESLARRVRVLEAIIIEGKRDQEILNNFLGDDYYNKYQLIKNKIKDPEYKDIYKLIKKDPDEVKNYIDSFRSKTDVRRTDKSEGAELIYRDSMWKVYKITTYHAARIYGSGTKWCITGRYDGHEEEGESYFEDYVEENDLDGGYYFYIKNDGKTKFCLLRRKNGRIHSIWNAADDSIPVKNILRAEPDFPSIDGVFIPPEPGNGDLFGEWDDIKEALKNSQDINAKCTSPELDYYGMTPLEWQLEHSIARSELLFDNGAELTPTMNWRRLMDWGGQTLFRKMLKRGLTDVVDVQEMLEYALRRAGSDWVKIVLNSGADPTKRFSNGMKPLEAEIRNEYGARVGVIKELVKRGADINEPCSNGKSLLDVANEVKAPNKVIELLHSLMGIESATPMASQFEVLRKRMEGSFNRRFPRGDFDVSVTLERRNGKEFIVADIKSNLEQLYNGAHEVYAVTMPETGDYFTVYDMQGNPKTQRSQWGLINTFKTGKAVIDCIYRRFGD